MTISSGLEALLAPRWHRSIQGLRRPDFNNAGCPVTRGVEGVKEHQETYEVFRASWVFIQDFVCLIGHHGFE